MARAGILYSHVAKAAGKLIEDGKNPTVDNVREALGDTGSKSTIAPMLKRWKAEHQEVNVAAELTIPAELLSVVKNVYDKIQEQARSQIDEAQSMHKSALQDAAIREQSIKTEYQVLESNMSEQFDELKRVRDALAKLQNEHHGLIVKFTGLESENAGLQQRLADRAAEVTALNQQLSHASKQFQHFQEAVATQRAEENRAADQRIALLERDKVRLQQQLIDHQRLDVQQAAQISSSINEILRLQEVMHIAQEQAATIGSERDRIVYQVKELAIAHHGLKSELATAQQLLIDVRGALAGQERETYLLRERLAAEEKIASAMETERIALIQDIAAMRATLETSKKSDRTER
ncbi:DNA-binding protein [Undibacterium sp. Di26W]|uniref:DNA-binding protein n=1 Tax=Undibacterium sp. Di26W TaxID=3413035 RepID=UPI003BF1FC96